jgi:hypothetical protein
MKLTVNRKGYLVELLNSHKSFEFFFIYLYSVYGFAGYPFSHLLRLRAKIIPSKSHDTVHLSSLVYLVF